MRYLSILLVVFVAEIWAKRAEIGYSGPQRLVGYWGQDAAGPSVGGGSGSYELSLTDTCKTTKFDIIAVSGVNTFWDNRNKGDQPSLDLANHCKAPDSSISRDEYPHLLRCPDIEAGIKECQKLGKKVILSVGGATGDGTLQSPAKARELANTFYDLFLGGDRTDGSTSLRSFGSAVMDGINLDIQGGSGDHYESFIREMRRLMDEDQNKEYLLTASPGCFYPDHYLGPEGGTALELAGEYVDHLYVKFYNDQCNTGSEEKFVAALRKWLDLSAARSPRGPLVFIGMPAAAGAASSSSHYRPPNELQGIYNKVGGRPFVGGIMLWDASWDQSNVISGKRYSEFASTQLKDSTITSNTSPAATQPPTASFTCDGKPDGVYADPDDCSKYYQCTGGAQAGHNTCPTGLLFNSLIKACDFADNVTC